MPPQLGSDDDDQAQEVEMKDVPTANGENETEEVSVETENIQHNEDHVMTEGATNLLANGKSKIPEATPRHPKVADAARLSLPPANGVDSTKPSLSPSAQKKREEQISAFTRVLSETPPDIAQKVLRDNWRFFLFENYNEWHVQYILRAGIKNSNQAILDKIFKDDGAFKSYAFTLASKDNSVRHNVINSASVQELLNHAKPNVLDNVNEKLIQKVLHDTTIAQALAYITPNVLDNILAERIKTADAKALITWLAQAERLGFAADDIVDENEEVIPNIQQDDMEMQQVYAPPIPPTAYISNISNSHHEASPPEMGRDALLVEQERNAAAAMQQNIANARAAELKNKHYEKLSKQSNSQQSSAPTARLSNLMCPLCRATPPTSSGYDYHVERRVCEKTTKPASGWPAMCSNCLQGFTTKQGKDYHVLKHVCGEPEEVESAEATRISPSRTDSGSSVVIPRPSFNTAPSHTNVASSSAFTSSSAPVRTGLPGRPPLGMPKRKQMPSDEVRGSPSDLPPERLAALNAELEEADRKMRQGIASIPADWDDAQRRAKIESLKNINGSKKSQTRKKYGVTLRKREKDKVATRMSDVGSANASAGSSSPAPISESKRAEIEQFRAQPRVGSGSNHQPLPYAAAHPVIAFSPINNAGSPAVTATQLPPMRLSPPTAPPRPHHQQRNPSSEPRTQPQNPNVNTYSTNQLPSHTSLPLQSSSGFGILRPENPKHLTQSDYQNAQHSHPHGHPNPQSNKRPRDLYEEQPPRPRPNGGQFRSNVLGAALGNGLIGGGGGLVEVRVEDAASKFPQKQGPFGPRTEAERRAAARASQASDILARVTSSGNAVRDSHDTKESAITIDDSDTEGESFPKSASKTATLASHSHPVQPSSPAVTGDVNSSPKTASPALQIEKVTKEHDDNNKSSSPTNTKTTQDAKFSSADTDQIASDSEDFATPRGSGFDEGEIPKDNGSGNGAWIDRPIDESASSQKSNSRRSSSGSGSGSNSGGEAKRGMPARRGAFMAKRGGGSKFGNWKMLWSS